MSSLHPLLSLQLSCPARRADASRRFIFAGPDARRIRRRVHGVRRLRRHIAVIQALMLSRLCHSHSKVVDVFAMPQSGTGVSVEAVDYVYQTQMMDRLKQTGRSVLSILCYSICRPLTSPLLLPDLRWSSDGTTPIPASAAGSRASTSIRSRCAHRQLQAFLRALLTPPRLTRSLSRTQSFEQLHPRCVAVVVDPIQSVKGKVVIDAFRLINPRGISQSRPYVLPPRRSTDAVNLPAQ